MNASKKTQIVLVDAVDKVIGLKEKTATHKVPVPLHRAISVIIFSKDNARMLITKRAAVKPTWPGIWSNAVCSHPFPNESHLAAAGRRLKEELGFKTRLKQAFKFIYKAEMNNGVWGECEFDTVFTGKYNGPIYPDPAEIDGYVWIGIGELRKDIRKNSDKYTPWFKIILKKLKA